MQALHKAFLNGDAEGVTAGLTAIMGRMISVLDTKARDAQKENFYHGLLLGLLRSEPTWLIRSNAESGEGFSDILVEPEDPDAGIVIEVKYAPRFGGLSRPAQGRWSRSRRGAMTSACGRTAGRTSSPTASPLIRSAARRCAKGCRVQ